MRDGVSSRLRRGIGHALEGSAEQVNWIAHAIGAIERFKRDPEYLNDLRVLHAEASGIHKRMNDLMSDARGLRVAQPINLEKRERSRLSGAQEVPNAAAPPNLGQGEAKAHAPLGPDGEYSHEETPEPRVKP